MRLNDNGKICVDIVNNDVHIRKSLCRDCKWLIKGRIVCECRYWNIKARADSNPCEWFERGEWRDEYTGK